MILGNKILTIALISGLFLFSCKEPGCTDPEALNYNTEANKSDNSCEYNGEIELNFILKDNQSLFSIYDTTSFDNNNFRLEKLKFYISDVYVTNGNDSTKLKDVHLVDFSNPESLRLKVDIKEGQYSALSFGIGLNEELNNTNPSNYSLDHPLGLNQNTYWAMTPASYIFIMLEGKLDTSSTNFYPTSYHLAHNDLYSFKNLNSSFSIESSRTTQIDIKVNLPTAFYNVDFSQDLPHQSVANPLAQQLMNNFLNAIELDQ